jgi:hypothetical protein
MINTESRPGESLEAYRFRIFTEFAAHYVSLLNPEYRELAAYAIWQFFSKPADANSQAA